MNMSKQTSPLSLKNALLASIGSGLEYYDFVIYLFLTPWLSVAFFPKSHHGVAMLQTLGIFFLGTAIKPLGSFLLGFYADKTGRRASYFAILTLMTISTLCIALCPTYQSIGFFAPLLLIIFRLVQSVSFGSDLPCGMILLAEHAPENKKGLYCGLLIMNVALGSSLGTGMSYLLLHIFTHHQMETFGWRIGFLIGVALNLIAFVCRRRIKETAIYLHFKHQLKKVSAFQINIKQCFMAMGILAFPAALVMIHSTLPFILPKVYHIAPNTVFLYLTIFGLMEAILIPFFSALSDFIGRQKFFISSIIIWLLVMPASFFYCLHNPTHLNLILFFALFNITLGLLAGSFFVLMAETFPIKTRVAQYALSYNIVYLIMSAIPLYGTWLVLHNQWLSGTLGLLAVLASLALITSVSARYQHKKIYQRWLSFQ